MFSLNHRIGTLSAAPRIGRETARTLARQAPRSSRDISRGARQLAARSREENLPIRCVRLAGHLARDWARVADQVGGRSSGWTSWSTMPHDGFTLFFDTETRGFRKTDAREHGGQCSLAPRRCCHCCAGRSGQPAGASMINICSTYGNRPALERRLLHLQGGGADVHQGAFASRGPRPGKTNIP